MFESILECVLLAGSLGATLLLFVSLKREMQNSTRKHHAQLGELQARLEQADLQNNSAFALGAPRAGINLHRRVHALRLLRRGETETHIAAALGVPQREVELLIRVQSMSASPDPANSSPTAIPNRY